MSGLIDDLLPFCLDPNKLAEKLAEIEQSIDTIPPDNYNAILSDISDLQAKVGGAVADIADPSTATAEDCANKINALMASLRTAGLLTP